MQAWILALVIPFNISLSTASVSFIFNSRGSSFLQYIQVFLDPFLLFVYHPLPSSSHLSSSIHSQGKGCVPTKAYDSYIQLYHALQHSRQAFPENKFRSPDHPNVTFFLQHCQFPGFRTEQKYWLGTISINFTLVFSDIPYFSIKTLLLFGTSSMFFQLHRKCSH